MPGEPIIGLDELDVWYVDHRSLWRHPARIHGERA
jgi:hypothetical protein